MAAGVYTSAPELGLSIPGDLSIVGFDDSPMAARLWPSLTTVRLPIRDMGCRGAIADGAPEGAPRRRPLVPHLIVRESCARAPASD